MVLYDSGRSPSLENGSSTLKPIWPVNRDEVTLLLHRWNSQLQPILSLSPLCLRTAGAIHPDSFPIRDGVSFAALLGVLICLFLFGLAFVAVYLWED